MTRKGRRSLVPACVLAVATALLMTAMTATTGATAQEKPYPIFTADQFVAAMKTAGLAFAAVNTSLVEGNAEDAKAYLVISRERLATTITFWRQRRKDDAVALLRETLTNMDALDTTLSVPKLDPVVATAAARQVQSSCQPCHALYREQDPGSKAYRLKPEVSR
jgi:hypothetical protein